jgi:DNA-binding IclR family transcriptional regulator
VFVVDRREAGARTMPRGPLEDEIMARTAKPASETARRRGIQSVEIGLNVLESLGALGQASTLSAVAQASGMAAPQVHRYLQSLISAGMAIQDPDTGRYDLGPKALKLGLVALARIDAFRLVDTAMIEFTQRTGQTVQIAALGPLGPTIVRWNMGRPAVMTSFNVGSVLPLLYSATGQTFLAFVPHAETIHLVERELKAGPMKRADAERLRLEVRARGFGHVEGAMVPGLRATAFPIFDLQGRAVLTATALSPDVLAAPGRDVALEELRGLCRDISAQLGWFGT